MPAMWHIALLSRASHELRRYSRIFPNVKSVQLSQTVLKGYYHEKEGIMQQTWNIEMMKQRLWKQVPETCEIREIHLPHELEGGDDAQSMTFDIAVCLAFVSEQMVTADPCFHSVCIKADDGWSYWSKKLASWANFVVWLAFWFGLAYVVVPRVRINKNDTGFDFQVGNAFWLMLYTALHTGSLSYLVQTSDVAET
ncbi:hypothetical protein C365_06838 [Cryptococcus neoformans Bt85]|nr:hypothetical protein C365_06846 [Cryptococcus neoformans var. grubii Bt85]OWZ74849.1 hypothetical protein C365_06838 [Cryptococcus neoformans var. grubii Bt85]OXM75734.1 hypothetical protein C364_06761 [Cryptococcus neoformans var. grubii Bt63]